MRWPWSLGMISTRLRAGEAGGERGRAARAGGRGIGAGWEQRSEDEAVAGERRGALLRELRELRTLRALRRPRRGAREGDYAPVLVDADARVGRAEVDADDGAHRRLGLLLGGARHNGDRREGDERCGGGGREGGERRRREEELVSGAAPRRRKERAASAKEARGGRGGGPWRRRGSVGRAGEGGEDAPSILPLAGEAGGREEGAARGVFTCKVSATCSLPRIQEKDPLHEQLTKYERGG